IDAVPQLMISTGDLRGRIAQWINPDVSEDSASKSVGDTTTRHPRPNLQTTYVAPSGEVEQTLAGILQDVIGVDQVGIHDNFFDLGGDSLLAVQVVARLREAFQVDLPLRDFFDTPTVAELAAVLTGSQPQPEQLDEAERLLREIESLPPDQVRAKLLEAEQSTSEVPTRE